jgi:sulfite exporter TauE/SafE
VTEIWLAFMAGLAGSGHCLGMCGGIVAALSVSNPQIAPARKFRLNLVYHLGRIFTYALLGLLAGAVSQMALFSRLKPHLSWLLVAAHVSVIAIGLMTVINIRRFSLAALDGGGWCFMQHRLKSASRLASAPAFFIAGLVMGLLPCGLVYGILLSSAASGSWVKGGVMMLAFGAGTLPALLAYGQVAISISALSNTLFLRIMGGMVALLGVVGLMKTLGVMGKI